MFLSFLVGMMLIAYTIACLVLIFVILIQSGKGGGLSSLGAASSGLTEALGATGAEKTLNRLTTWCAVGFMVLALLLSLAGPHTFNKGKNETLVREATPAAASQAPIAPNPGQTAPAGSPAESAPGPDAATAPVPAGAAAPANAKPPLPPFGSVKAENPVPAATAPAPGATAPAPAPAATVPAPAATAPAPAPAATAPAPAR